MQAPEPRALEGRHVRLEPLEPRHRDDLVAAAGEDPATFRYMSTNIAAHGWDAWLAEALDGVAAGRYVAWATVDRASGRAVGSTRFGDISPADGRLEIGWTWIAPSRQRTGINTEAKLVQLTLRLRRPWRDAGCAQDRWTQPAVAGGDRTPGRRARGGSSAAPAPPGRVHPRHRLLLDPRRRVARRP